MKKVSLILLCLFNISLYSQLLQDDFEGSSSINWQQDDCEVIEAFENPYLEGINTSNNVLSYHDTGGSFANAFFNYSASINLGTNTVFSFKIYVPSSGVTGNQPNQVSLKLQNNQIPAPWSTQTEIIKPIILDEWQEVSFDFANDNYINLSPDSPAPLNRNDLNKVLIQINGENNTDEVLAYIDDFYFQGEESDEEPVEDPIYDELVWADEFDGNGAIDFTKWHHQTVLPLNGNSWFNGEIQHYTNRTDNSYLDNGELHIVAKNETFTDQGITKDYTSARLNSKFAFTYGRVEVKAKLPTGVGTWPAIWMLGTNIEEIGTYWDNEGFGTTPWPACGEIDIMEHWGTNQNYISSAMHTPSSFGGTINHGGQVIPTASTDYHVYTLEWFPNRMVFSVDDVVHYTYQPNVYNADTWPFDKDQFILLNIAIEPSIDSTFTESSMDIDYVRIYQETNLSSNDFTVENKLKIAPNPAINQTHIYAPAEAMGTQLSIFDTQGRLIDKVSIHTTRVQINTSEWSPGIYLIKETNTKQSHTYKLIKQ
ncbi:family 16 glycosylhydrolase [Psychroflexus salis]|nr:family 16 glycosylhydrolase [Psychroflexus salis]